MRGGTDCACAVTSPPSTGLACGDQPDLTDGSRTTGVVLPGARDQEPVVNVEPYDQKNDRRVGGRLTMRIMEDTRHGVVGLFGDS